MSEKTLCIGTFGEIVRKHMKKKAYIKNYDADKKSFPSDAEVMRLNLVDVNLSYIYPFYKLLLDAVIYRYEGEGIPDISSTMTSELKNGNMGVNDKIIELAQRNDAKGLVAEYFCANLVPNITAKMLPTVLDGIDSLVQADKSLGSQTQKRLKQARQQAKDEAHYLADVWLLALLNNTNYLATKAKNVILKKASEQRSDNENAFEPVGDTMDKLQSLLAKLPTASPAIEPTAEIEEHEIPYIKALYSAYGDALKIDDFDETKLLSYPDYSDDLNERRIDYFTAYTVYRDVLEFGDGAANPFNILKDEVYEGVGNTARKTFIHGYERMLSVMEQVVIVKIVRFYQSYSKYWIDDKVKKGTCHFLVIDGRLKWVRV
jgi:uncharacterized protein YdcH (DUF465 family)